MFIDQLKIFHEKTKYLTIFEKNLKDCVYVNQMSCVERELAIAEREQAIVELQAE